MRSGYQSDQQPGREAGPRSGLMVFLQRWIINTVAVLVATHIVPGIRYETVPDLFVASLLFGILIAFLRPVLFWLTLPLVVLSLGFFVLVINAGLLYLVGSLVKGFHVDGFWPAFWGALTISLVSLILNTFTGSGDGRVRVRRTAPETKPPGDDGNGPVIDV